MGHSPPRKTTTIAFFAGPLIELVRRAEIIVQFEIGDLPAQRRLVAGGAAST